MEINPRYWGSLALPIHAGVDFPYYHYGLAVGDAPSIDPGAYETGVGCHKLRGELLYLYNVYRGVGDGPRPHSAASVSRSSSRCPGIRRSTTSTWTIRSRFSRIYGTWSGGCTDRDSLRVPTDVPDVDPEDGV